MNGRGATSAHPDGHNPVTGAGPGQEECENAWFALGNSVFSSSEWRAGRPVPPGRRHHALQARQDRQAGLAAALILTWRSPPGRSATGRPYPTASSRAKAASSLVLAASASARRSRFSSTTSSLARARKSGLLSFLPVFSISATWPAISLVRRAFSAVEVDELGDGQGAGRLAHARRAPRQPARLRPRGRCPGGPGSAAGRGGGPDAPWSRDRRRSPTAAAWRRPAR